MQLLETYLECFRTGDASRLASLFTQDADFYDDAAVKAGSAPVAVHGRDNIRDFFGWLFRHGGLKVTNVAMNGNAMRYDVEVGDLLILALGLMKEEDGLIKEYRVVAV